MWRFWGEYALKELEPGPISGQKLFWNDRNELFLQKHNMNAEWQLNVLGGKTAETVLLVKMSRIVAKILM